jgi:anti-sigma regulatory factor (Ser/Thr protein kinase)
MHALRRTSAKPEPGPLPGEFVILFSSTPRGARLARLLAVQRLDAWGIPYGSGHSDDAAVLVAELAANAVQHGQVDGRDFRLRVTLRRELLRIAVSDTRGDRGPRVGVPGPDAQAGRGLLLVEAIAARWGVTEWADGKTVWCEYLLARRAAR